MKMIGPGTLETRAETRVNRENEKKEKQNRRYDSLGT
jgi:hypothetical protein